MYLEIYFIICFSKSSSTYTGVIQYGHLSNSNAECINAGIIIYLPTWISLQSYNSTTSGVNYTTDNSSYALFSVGFLLMKNLLFFNRLYIFQLGTLLFNDVGSLTFTLNIDTSNQMASIYSRYYAPSITIPYELMCMKRPR